MMDNTELFCGIVNDFRGRIFKVYCDLTEKRVWVQRTDESFSSSNGPYTFIEINNEESEESIALKARVVAIDMVDNYISKK